MLKYTAAFSISAQSTTSQATAAEATTSKTASAKTTSTLSSAPATITFGVGIPVANPQAVGAAQSHAQTVTLSDANGSNLVTIKVQEAQVRIQALAKVVVEAPQIELVDGAAHPLVFGDNLLQYLNQLVALFNSHVHPGELAAAILPVVPTPPAPPFPPATPALLSLKVKTG